jgi:hypothetical protein
MNDLRLTNEMFQDWIVELRKLPPPLRYEAINKRWNHLTPKQRESIAYLFQQIEEERTKAQRARVRRSRAIGPVDKAVRRMEDYSRGNR